MLEALEHSFEKIWREKKKKKKKKKKKEKEKKKKKENPLSLPSKHPNNNLVRQHNCLRPKILLTTKPTHAKFLSQEI